MSQENVERARRAFAALQRDDIEEFLSYVDPEAEWNSLVLEMEGAFHGHDGVRQWWASLLAVFPDWRPTIVEVRDVDDCVLLHARGSGTGAGSGVGIDEDFWQVAQMQGGRIVWYGAFRTEQEALEAVGLREQAT
jgi:ketosteroid isomerase-like protein